MTRQASIFLSSLVNLRLTWWFSIEKSIINVKISTQNSLFFMKKFTNEDFSPRFSLDTDSNMAALNHVAQYFRPL
jgi:hypothetical protein